MKGKANLRSLVVSAVMGGVGTVLMAIEFGLPFLPPFLKVDFSELPVLLTSFACGPVYGVLVALIKNVLHLFMGTSMGVGELANFLLGAVFAAFAGIIYKKKKTRKGALIAALSASVIMAAASIAINYFIAYPLYGVALGFTNEAILEMYRAIVPSIKSLPQALLIFNVPLTFIKELIVTGFTFAIYKPLSPILKGKVK